MNKLSLSTFPTMRAAYAAFESLTSEFKSSFRRKETVALYLSHTEGAAAEIRVHYDNSPTQMGEMTWFVNQAANLNNA